MPFPNSPTNGQTYVLNNTSYTYNSAQGTWTATQAGVSTPIVIAANTAATSTGTGALQVVGGIGVQGNVYTANVGFADGSVFGSASSLGTRNRIINGTMVIDQRNAGASVTSGYPVDRFQVYSTQSGKWSAQQSSTAPTNFTKSVVITSSGTYSPISSDYFSFTTRIEGYNVSDFNWGTANAQTITVSFWVRSSLTGTWTGALHNNAFNRVYPFSYTISAANTWEQKTLTIAGDTTGTWTTDNSVGLEIGFAFSVGSAGLATAGSWSSTANIFGATGQTNLLGTNGATFYITGVQLEVGSVATPFERRQYGQELMLCQRYYQIVNAGQATGSGASTTVVFFQTTFPVTMRSSPTSSSTATSIVFYQASTNSTFTGGSVAALNTASIGAVEFQVSSYSGLTVGSWGTYRSCSSGQIAFNAEL